MAPLESMLFPATEPNAAYTHYTELHPLSLQVILNALRGYPPTALRRAIFKQYDSVDFLLRDLRQLGFAELADYFQPATPPKDFSELIQQMLVKHNKLFTL